MKIDECIKIYKDAFGSSEPFDTMLFEGFGDCIHTVQREGKIVSMLFKLPCELEFGGKSEKIYYIYAAATDDEYRGRGYMSALIRDVAKKSADPLFLKPATKELEGFYEKIGFKKINATAKKGSAFISVSEKHRQLSSLCDNCPQNYILMTLGDLPKEIEELSFPHTMG